MCDRSQYMNVYTIYIHTHCAMYNAECIPNIAHCPFAHCTTCHVQ